MYCIESVKYFELLVIFTGPELLSRTWTYLEGQQRSMQHKNVFFEVSPETRNGTDGSDNLGRIYEVQLENQAHRIHGTNGIFTYIHEWLKFVVYKCRKKRYQSHGSYWKRPGLLLSISLLPDLHNWLRSPVCPDFVGMDC